MKKSNKDTLRFDLDPYIRTIVMIYLSNRIINKNHFLCA